MEKEAIGGISATLLLMGAALVGLSGLLISFITKIYGAFRPGLKSAIAYLLLVVLFFAGAAGLVYVADPENHFVLYLCCQGYFLLLGTGHVYLMPKCLQRSERQWTAWVELGFTLLAGLLGGIGFIVVYRLVDQQGLALLLATSIGCFGIPWLIYQTFQQGMAIPEKIFNRWFYPVDEKRVEPEDGEFVDMLLISFMLQKRSADARLIHTRAKAPEGMKWGELFYYFINDFNESTPHGPIEYADEAGEPYGWVFYKKQILHPLLPQYIDWTKTVAKNGIRENDVIICQRVKQ